MVYGRYGDPYSRYNYRRGALYEGDFEEWCEQMSELFIAKGRPTQAYPSISHVEEDGTIQYHESNVADILVIVENIGSAFKQRMNFGVKVCVGELYAYVKKLCEPCRILDLPTEIRLRIYKAVLNIDSPNKTITHYGRRPHLPTMSHTNRQIRSEVLPIYFSDSTSHIGSSQSLSVWSGAVLRASYKCLRKIKFNLCAQKRIVEKDSKRLRLTQPYYIDFQLELNGEQGLRIKCPPELKLESRKKVEDVIEGVEAEREAGGFKSESLVWALEDLAIGGRQDTSADHWLDLYVEDGEYDPDVDYWL